MAGDDGVHCPARRPPRGGRGLKLLGHERLVLSPRRPPRGGRGLKFVVVGVPPAAILSPPSRGAWIEMLNRLFHFLNPKVAPLAGGVD